MPVRRSISRSQVEQLLQVTRLLTVTADLDKLLVRIAESACRMLSCQRASIFLYDPRTDQLWSKVALQSQEIRLPSGSGIVGHVFKTNRVLHVRRPYEDPRFNPEPDRRSGFVTRNLLTAPMVDIDGRPVGVLQAVNKNAGSFTASDQTMIQLLAGQAGVAIQRYNLQQEVVQAEKLRREMDLARAVQQAMIPQSPPEVEGIESAGWMKPAEQTGGDCYDLWRTPDGRLGIFLGDATGHGIAPAIIVSQTRSLVRALCQLHSEPRQILASINARLVEDLQPDKFVTAFVGFLSSDGRLCWCSAGHGPILIRGANGRISALLPQAPPLGILPEFEPDTVEAVHLDSGGMICISSDGITEAFSPDGRQFGVERLMEILNDSKARPHELIRRVGEAVRQWQGGDEPRDDQTLVVAARL